MIDHREWMECLIRTVYKFFLKNSTIFSYIGLSENFFFAIVIENRNSHVRLNKEEIQ